MILQALVEYYEALERKEKITSPGWCRARVAYGLDISEQGSLWALSPLRKSSRKAKDSLGTPGPYGTPDGFPLFRCICQFPVRPFRLYAGN